MSTPVLSMDETLDCITEVAVSEGATSLPTPVAPEETLGLEAEEETWEEILSPLIEVATVTLEEPIVSLVPSDERDDVFTSSPVEREVAVTTREAVSFSSTGGDVETIDAPSSVTGGGASRISIVRTVSVRIKVVT